MKILSQEVCQIVHDNIKIYIMNIIARFLYRHKKTTPPLTLFRNKLFHLITTNTISMWMYACRYVQLSRSQIDRMCFYK